MSGWGCRYQIDERCLLLRKECKPGMPGCVLYKKVHFISEVEATAKQPPRRRAKRVAPARPAKQGRRRRA